MVKRVDTRGKGITLHYLDTEKNRAGAIHARSVVSTIPLFRLFEVQFEPALSNEKRVAIASQTWGSYFKAHVFVKSAATRYWEKGEHSILPILSDSELGVIYDGAPDHEGKLRLLSLLITGDQAEAFNFAQLDEVRSKIKMGLDKLWPGIANEIIDMEFYRYHPRAVAGWPVGRSRFDASSDEVRKPERGIYFAGDFTESTHSSGAFESAHRVVRQILEGRGSRK
jgi:monoamine oxidase